MWACWCPAYRFPYIVGRGCTIHSANLRAVKSHRIGTTRHKCASVLWKVGRRMTPLLFRLASVEELGCACSSHRAQRAGPLSGIVRKPNVASMVRSAYGRIQTVNRLAALIQYRVDIPDKALGRGLGCERRKWSYHFAFRLTTRQCHPIFNYIPPAATSDNHRLQPVP